MKRWREALQHTDKSYCDTVQILAGSTDKSQRSIVCSMSTHLLQSYRLWEWYGDFQEKLWVWLPFFKLTHQRARCWMSPNVGDFPSSMGTKTRSLVNAVGTVSACEQVCWFSSFNKREFRFYLAFRKARRTTGWSCSCDKPRGAGLSQHALWEVI